MHSNLQIHSQNSWQVTPEGFKSLLLLAGFRACWKCCYEVKVTDVTLQVSHRYFWNATRFLEVSDWPQLQHYHWVRARFRLLQLPWEWKALDQPWQDCTEILLLHIRHKLSQSYIWPLRISKRFFSTEKKVSLYPWDIFQSNKSYWYSNVILYLHEWKQYILFYLFPSSKLVSTSDIPILSANVQLAFAGYHIQNTDQ